MRSRQGIFRNPTATVCFILQEKTTLDWYINNDQEDYETQSMAVRIGEILVSTISGETETEAVIRMGKKCFE